MEKPTDKIPGIFNYCDRWCEKCPYTKRCSNYELNEEHSNTNSEDLITDDFVEKVKENFETIVDLLQEATEGGNLDQQKLNQKATDIDIKEPQYSIAQEKLIQLSIRYYKTGNDWINSHLNILEEKEKELQHQDDLGINIQEEVKAINEALEVIQYYLFFIHIKTKRAINGLQDDWMMETFPIQNDANGSAKVAIIAIERSLEAWEIIRQKFPESEDASLNLLSTLSKILRGMKNEFPKTGLFIRIGFDEA